MRTRALTLLTGALMALFPLAGGTPVRARTGPAPQASGSPADTSLLPDPAAVARLPAALHDALRQDPVAYFRFVNHQWTRRVCQAFMDELPTLPAVRLHGDAHVEQYAVTDTTRGLDDFDDSASGPSVVDIVRFLGSIDLVSRRRNWSSELDTAVGAFFDGYRKGLGDSGYLPAEPAVVPRVRAKARNDRAAFLAWAESLMVPFDEAGTREARELLHLLETMMQTRPSGVPAGFLELKKGGALNLGIGSALTNKVLLRVEGPSPAPEDDRIIEAKELSNLEGIDCLIVPASGEVFRVIYGADQIGRIRHDVLADVPRKPGRTSEARDWWVKSWQPSYAELELSDLVSASELVEVAHDVGAQLGSANLRQVSPARQAQFRRAESTGIARLEPRIRRTVRLLVDDLLDAWRQFTVRPPAAR